MDTQGGERDGSHSADRSRSERRQTRGRRSYDRRNATFLAEASRLLASSLDYETTLGTVAMLSLPHLGAWCIVDIVEEEGGIRRVAIVHPDPEKQELARRLREGWPPTRDDPLGVPAVARTRKSEVLSDIDDVLLERMARSPANLALLEKLGIGSLMVVPLVARGDVLGAITFVGPEDGHHYTRSDLALAEDLATRAAVAIDNARLFGMAERAREMAERANQAKSQFLGVMSHELRTPINAILGYTQLLDMGVRGGLTDDQRALLQRVEASGRHLLEMVTRLLDMSKAEAGELTVHTELNLADEVVTSAVKLARSGAGGRQIEYRHAARPLHFLGDGIRVRQILVNLLTNAIQSTDENGSIVVTCEHVDGSMAPGRLRGQTGPWLRITVQDDGVGIAEYRLDAVFEPFVQGDTSPLVRTKDGTGVGLALSRNLARIMGGELTVASTPGEGARFSLWLPAPRIQAGPRRDRRLLDRDTEALALLSDHLLRRLKVIMDRYVEGLRQDGGVPRAGEATEVALRDHVPHFLPGIASLLSHSDAAGPEISAVLQGGNAIQRLTLELHGAERHAMGWSAEAVRRDLAILRAVIEQDLRAEAPPQADMEQITATLERLFDQAERISLQGWHYARSDNPAAVEGGRGRPLPAPKRPA